MFFTSYFKQQVNKCDKPLKPDGVKGTNINLSYLTSKICQTAMHHYAKELHPLTHKALKLQMVEFFSSRLLMLLSFFFILSVSLPPLYLLLCSALASSPSLCLHPPSLSLPSPSLSKWVSSGVLAGQNHLRANTLLSVVKASPQIPFYTHKCHFPFVCTLAALAEPTRPRASSQTRPAEEN